MIKFYEILPFHNSTSPKANNYKHKELEQNIRLQTDLENYYAVFKKQNCDEKKQAQLPDSIHEPINNVQTHAGEQNIT